MPPSRELAVPSNSRDSSLPSAYERAPACSYCGETLDPRYHFCRGCATPYRDADEAVYGETPKPKPSIETRIMTEAKSAWQFFCLIAIGLVVLGTITQILGPERMATSLLIQEVFLATLTLAYAIYHWRDVRAVFRDFRLDWLAFACLPMLAAFLVVNYVYHGFVQRLFDIDMETALAPLLENLSPTTLLFSICVFPGVVEEIGFRGVVQDRMVRAVGKGWGFAATSVLFTALHFSIISAPYLFGLSMFLCWVRARTRTIYIPILLHFTHNFVVMVVFYGVEI